LDQSQRIGHALLVPPVGCMDLLFDGGAVEGAVRKAVDAEYVQALFAQPSAKARELIAFEQLATLGSRQTQTDAERLVRCEARLECGSVALQAGQDLGPALRGVDVGAVRESQEAVVTQSHPLSGRST